MSKLLTIPTFIVFDGDTDKIRDWEVIQHKKENKALFTIKGYATENEWPTDNIIKSDLVCWKLNLTETIKAEFGTDWEKYVNQANSYYDNAGDLHKNPLAIAKVLELSWNKGKKSAILLKLIDDILAFAASVSS